MKDDKKSTVVKSGGSGIGFCGLLTLVFIVLKLIGVINWNWFWVLSPMVFGIAFWLILIIFLFVVVVLFGIIKGIIENI